MLLQRKVLPANRICLRMAVLSIAMAPAAGCRDHECARYAMPDNQIQPMLSSDSSLVLTVPRVSDSAGDIFWRVTIADTSGAELYVDSGSDFVGNLNVYWKWDGDGRAWLYNSDDGIVHFYSNESGAWEHVVYGPAGLPSSNVLPEPPDGLFPGYVDETGH